MSTESACCPYKLIIFKRKLHIPLLDDLCYVRGPILRFALNVKFGYQIAVLIAHFLMVSSCCFCYGKSTVLS